VAGTRTPGTEEEQRLFLGTDPVRRKRGACSMARSDQKMSSKRWGWGSPARERVICVSGGERPCLPHPEEEDYVCAGVIYIEQSWFRHHILHRLSLAGLPMPDVETVTDHTGIDI
jgi:hypothetical protein